MAKYKLLLPKMGESVAEATIIKWTKKPGDYIEVDETVMEIATDKVDSDVPSPVAGKLLEQLCKDNDVVQVGAVIAIIETDEPETVKEQAATPVIEQSPIAAPITQPAPEVYKPGEELQQPDFVKSNPVFETPIPIPGVKTPEEKQPVFTETRKDLIEHVPFTEQLEQKGTVKTEENGKNGLRFYSPLVKNIAAQEGIGNDELDKIAGTGSEGRLTKDDLLNYIQNRHKAVPASQSSNAPVTEQPAAQPVASAATVIETPRLQPFTDAPKAAPVAEAPQAEPVKPVENKAASSTSLSGGDEIIEMDRMRRLIADHMVMSKHTSPHVTSFVEADVTNLVHWRERIKSSFEKREGQKITFTPIFIEAVVRAIKDLPMINVSVNGTQIIKKKDINISMATALPSGNLIVPVIKKADELSLLGITKAVNDLANRARTNKLKPDDVQDGTFTITNVGSFGNVMGTPIINQPQVAILAVGAIRKKPAVIETLQGDMIGIRHMMFLSLSYDHRVVDGALGGSFVKRVSDYLENWDTSREI
jgi:2-oxoglutarate dehydrogenase E2 component (dihydrolipoamide succinyltransferase)